ncbi:MAG TPA: hypothetical protein PK323_03905 [Bacteroidia bacterium]|nr:hypothetical protein [Bacteroidia bacterium]
MKKISLIFSICLIFQVSLYAQQNSGIFAGNDTSVCNGGSLNLHATLNVLPNVTSTGITLTDDQYSQVINLGFTFNFYGNNYTQCLISTNGYITFDLSGAGGYSPWSINNPIPSAANPTNSIMGPWQDVNPGVGGTFYTHHLVQHLIEDLLYSGIIQCLVVPVCVLEIKSFYLKPPMKLRLTLEINQFAQVGMEVKQFTVYKMQQGLLPLLFQEETRQLSGQPQWKV